MKGFTLVVDCSVVGDQDGEIVDKHGMLFADLPLLQAFSSEGR
jgi:hypothetical protein